MLAGLAVIALPANRTYADKARRQPQPWWLQHSAPSCKTAVAVLLGVVQTPKLRRHGRVVPVCHHQLGNADSVGQEVNYSVVVRQRTGVAERRKLRELLDDDDPLNLVTSPYENLGTLYLCCLVEQVSVTNKSANSFGDGYAFTFCNILQGLLGGWAHVDAQPARPIRWWLVVVGR